jgi:quercetin dioxygenase-like cupin family protein
MDSQDRLPHPEVTDLDSVTGGDGVVWSVSPGLHLNLVVLGPGTSMPSHVNDALDVLLIALTGTATVEIDEHQLTVRRHGAVLIPRGSRRAITASDDGVRYLTIHPTRPASDLRITSST